MVQATGVGWSVRLPDDEGATPFDRLVEGWNRLFPFEREDAIAACRREGHPPHLDLGYTRVCPRCLRYSDAPS